MDIGHGKFNLWQRQTCDIFGDEAAEHNERGEAAIDGAVAAGETSAAQGTLDDGEDDGRGTISTGARTKPTEWAKMSKSQRNRWSRRNKK